MKSEGKAVAKAKKTPKAEGARKACIRVLIADDHSVVREGLVSLIGRRADMAVVGEASNGREAVDLWKKHQPDVTLLDLRMPSSMASEQSKRSGLKTRVPG
jgi:Response regulator containing CheY-like receiver domain and AraC-type DNA-binding domain